jgi:hypothetical protein
MDVNSSNEVLWKNGLKLVFERVRISGVVANFSENACYGMLGLEV